MTDLRLIVNRCQHRRHGGDDPRICQDCGVALDIPTYDGRYRRIPEWRRRALERVERDGNVAVVDLTNS